jgi:hypothetical protein
MIEEILQTGRRIVKYLRNSKNFTLKCRSTNISLLFLKLLSVNVRIPTGSFIYILKRGRMHVTCPHKEHFLFLKGIMCGKKIPIVFRVYQKKLEGCKEIPQKGTVRSSIIVQ